MIFLRIRELRENREAVNTRKTSGTRVPRIGKFHYYYRDCHRFEKLPFQNVRRALVFKFLRFEKSFLRLRFRYGLVWAEGLAGRFRYGLVWAVTKAVFLNSSGVSVLTGPPLLMDLAIRP